MRCGARRPVPTIVRREASGVGEMPRRERRGGARAPQREFAAIEQSARLSGGGVQQEIGCIHGGQPRSALSGKTVASLIPSEPALATPASAAACRCVGRDGGLDVVVPAPRNHVGRAECRIESIDQCPPIQTRRERSGIELQQ